MKTRRIRAVCLGLAALASAPAAAQVRSGGIDDEAPPIVDARTAPPVQPARTSDTTPPPVGQRQGRDSTARQAGVEPMARISNRIANRVQARLRTRIDRGYDPRANAVSPFVVAEEQARTGGRRR